MDNKTKIGISFVSAVLFCVLIIWSFSDNILTWVGTLIVKDEKPIYADAVVVLNTGIAYYPRLIEAASLYGQGLVKKVIINGNRKTEILRELEKKGYQPCCAWYEGRIRILELLGVKREDVIAISVEDAYDTISEAKAVGKFLSDRKIKKIIITTSKYHTRRACYIWKSLYKDKLVIKMVAAKRDPYSPKTWWKSGRQIKSVLAEYGAWLYYYWKKAMRDIDQPMHPSSKIHFACK